MPHIKTLFALEQQVNDEHGYIPEHGITQTVSIQIRVGYHMCMLHWILNSMWCCAL